MHTLNALLQLIVMKYVSLYLILKHDFTPEPVYNMINCTVLRI